MVDDSRTRQQAPVPGRSDGAPDGTAGRWSVIVPVKDPRVGKTRLVASLGAAGDETARVRLGRAIATDTLAAVAAAVGAEHLVLVTADAELAATWRAAGATVTGDPGLGLNAAVSAGLSLVAPGRPVAVLLGDVPSLTARDLLTALEVASEHPQALVPDLEGDGTVLRTSNGTAGPLLPRFGHHSASRHAADGAVPLPLELPRLRRDVDDAASLAHAQQLGLGPTTAEALAQLGMMGGADTDAPVSGWMDGMQATVHTFDPTSLTGSVIQDDGVVIAFDDVAFAASGLLHVRPGQRLTVDLEAGEIVRLRIRGIGPVGTAEPVA